MVLEKSSRFVGSCTRTIRCGELTLGQVFSPVESDMLMRVKLAIKTDTHVVSTRLCKVKVGPKRLTTKLGELFSEGPLRLIKRNLLAKDLKPKLVIVVISQLLKRL